MMLEVQIGERTQTLELEREKDAWVVRRGDVVLAADVAVINERTVSVILDGRSFTVCWERLERGPGTATLWLGTGGAEATADARDPRRAVARKQFHQTGRVQLKAPMAGKVVRLAAEPGTAIEAGTAVLVLEAMKMQNEVRSPKAGTVTSIAVKTGDTVATGQLLAEVE